MKKTVRTTIKALSVCLALSVLAIAGTLIYMNFIDISPESVSLPKAILRAAQEESTESEQSYQAPQTGENVDSASVSEENKFASALYLYEKHEGDNTPFHVTNMFPGDTETNYYCVRVAHKGSVTVRFHADIREGFEKLAEVLKCRIVLLSTGETLYDGLMRDMPSSIDHPLDSSKETTDELYYSITAYLDTSVGNDYQNKQLIADFKWWVEETDNLVLPPKTGAENTIIYTAAAVFAISAVLILILKKRNSKEEGEQHA